MFPSPQDGEKKRVGNPLAKDFLSKIEEGVLSSYHGNNAEVVLKCNKMCSYWKNNMDRIRLAKYIYNFLYNVDSIIYRNNLSAV